MNKHNIFIIQDFSPLIRNTYFARFVFNVYTSNESLQVNQNLLIPLVKMMPFAPDVEFLGELLGCMTDMMKDPIRFQCILSPGARVFAEMLLMKKSQLDEFELDQELVSDMKETLKTTVKQNPEIGKQISNEFKSSKAKLNRFNSLVR